MILFCLFLIFSKQLQLSVSLSHPFITIETNCFLGGKTLLFRGHNRVKMGEECFRSRRFVPLFYCFEIDRYVTVVALCRV